MTNFHCNEFTIKNKLMHTLYYASIDHILNIIILTVVVFMKYTYCDNMYI